MKTAIQSTIVAVLALAGSSALADDHALTFEDVDANGDGQIVLSEVQAFDPEVTEEGFASYDANEDGALDQAEFDAWQDAGAEEEGEEPMDGEQPE